MNDWLTYKGSGSSRAVIAHAAYKSNTKPIAQNDMYNIINSELDRVYSKSQDAMSRRKTLNATEIAFINSAHKLKADLVIFQTKGKQFLAAYDEVSKKVSNYKGSELQKTALRNKLDTIANKFNSSENLIRLGSDLGIDTLNTLIDDINNRTLGR